MVEGDDHREAYTAIVWGELLSRERYDIAEAEAVDSAHAVEGGARRATEVRPLPREACADSRP